MGQAMCSRGKGDVKTISRLEEEVPLRAEKTDPIKTSEPIYEEGPIYDKGMCQFLRGTFCCPVGGRESATVPQYVKDAVDGELGDQSHAQYPPPCLLIPECAAICETSKCCVCCGKCGNSGPCGENSDPNEGRRHCLMCFNILLVVIGGIMFIPLALSNIDTKEVVDSLYWHHQKITITGKRVWSSSADTVGTLSLCPAKSVTNGTAAPVSNASVAPVSNVSVLADPACGLTFEYKVSPGGTLIDGPKDFSAGASGPTSKLHEEYRKVSMCQKYMGGTRKSACDDCKKSMTLSFVSSFMTLGGLLLAINDILGRWDRNYDLNFNKCAGVIGSLFTIPQALVLVANFQVQCVDKLFEKGIGEMTKGSYTPSTLGVGQEAALQWTIEEVPNIGKIEIVGGLVSIVLLLRGLTTMCLPVSPAAGNYVKLTEPWDLGYGNMDEATKTARVKPASIPGWSGFLKCCSCVVGCCPQCTVLLFEPLLCLKDLCTGLGCFSTVMCIGYFILAPCHRLCPCLFVNRPGMVPPRKKRGVVRPISCSNPPCAQLWQDVKDNKMKMPMQQSMNMEGV